MSTMSTHPEVASKESIPPESAPAPLTVNALPMASLAVSVSLELTQLSALSTCSVPPEEDTLSNVGVPLELSDASTESVPFIDVVKSTESMPSEVTSELTESVPLEATTVSLPSVPPKVTKTSAENSIPAAELTKARDDAERLHRAFEGLGCDKTTIIKLITDRSATQRALIRQEYRTKFSEDLDNRLSKELSSDLKKAVLLWMPDPASRDATLVKQDLDKTLEIAIEVICSRTPSQIEQLKKAYSPMSGSHLEADIDSHAHGDTKKLLLAYVGTPRSEGPEVDAMMVDKDAKALYKDGEYKLGTNEGTFIRIFSERSWAHLAKVNTAYRSMYVNSLKKAIKNETSWKFKSGLLTILQCAENPAKYFAKVLCKAMKGIGTDEDMLSRIIVSRAEIDIQQIKAEYHKKYKKSLSDVVHSETSGNYRAFLISLLDTNN